MMRYIQRGVVLAASLVLPLISQQSVADVDVTFHGTLVETVPCDISGGETIVADFGDSLQTTRLIESSAAPTTGPQLLLKRQVLIMPDVMCPLGVAGTIRLKLKGAAASFNSNALAGDREGVGFLFGASTSAMLPVNQWVVVSANTNHIAPAMPILMIRQDNYVPEAGPFDVMASLIADYQ